MIERNNIGFWIKIRGEKFILQALAGKRNKVNDLFHDCNITTFYFLQLAVISILICLVFQSFYLLITKEKIVESLLPSIDSFDMAMANKEAWESVDKNWRTGVEYIYQQIITGLSDVGVEIIDKTGIKFDPNLHQSIESITTDDESKDHTIEKIVQAGYKIGDRVIRPARVNIFEYKK